jgi:hypothetical protein
MMPKARLLLVPILLAACNAESGANATEGTAQPQAAGQPFTVTPVADFESPWAMAARW